MMNYPTADDYNNQPNSQPSVISQQPTVASNEQIVPRRPLNPYRTWSSGICACFEDFTSCCCTFLFPNCYLCYLSSRQNESCCVPFCVPMSLVSLRVKHRHRHGIHGSVMDDFCTVCFCGACAICQLKRDFDFVEDCGYYL